MNYVKPVSSGYFYRQPQFMKYRVAILQKIADSAMRFMQYSSTIDVNTVNVLVRCSGALSERADDRNLVPRGSQGSCFKPHSTIKWNGQILDDDENTSGAQTFTS